MIRSCYRSYGIGKDGAPWRRPTRENRVYAGGVQRKRQGKNDSRPAEGMSPACFAGMAPPSAPQCGYPDKCGRNRLASGSAGGCAGERKQEEGSRQR